MNFYPKTITRCFIASLALLGITLASAEEKERIVTQEFAIGLIDFVQDKHPDLHDSSSNTIALIVLQEIVNQHYGVNEDDDDIKRCRGLSRVNENFIRHRQVGLSKERSWEATQSYISALEIMSSDLDFPIPSEPERRILLNYAYAEPLDTTKSSQKEQYTFLAGRDYESCVR